MNAGGMLVLAPERWDEACFVVPALRAGLAAGLDSGVLCAAAQRPFWETVNGLKVVEIPVKASAKMVAVQLAGNWQASLAWQAGLAAEACQRAGIPKRLGADERKLNKLLTHPLGFSAGPLEHRVRHYLAAFEELGVETSRPEFFAAAALGIEAIPAAVLLCPGSDFGASHEWPLARWVEIATRLLESGKQLTVASDHGGRGLGQSLAQKLGDRCEVLVISSLAEVLPQLAAQRLVIAADGSLPHVAAHVGATCLTLFGPNDPAWKRPLGRQHRVVRRHVECGPCLLAKCPFDQRCQNELESEQVWEAVTAILG